MFQTHRLCFLVSETIQFLYALIENSDKSTLIVVLKLLSYIGI